jgi:hypothetical protein
LATREAAATVREVRIPGLILALLVLIAGAVVWFWRQRTVPPALPPPPRTVEQVIAALGDAVDGRLRPDFHRAGVEYPPPRLVMVAYKAEKRLDLHAPDARGRLRLVRSYPVLAASGGRGPKRQEGDGQVPEGFYGIELLNPNSRFHLSLRVDYPNAEDVARAREEGRDPSSLGGDIMIHGGAASIGCLAMGDPAAEELFVLVHRTGLDEVEVIMAPNDLREDPPQTTLDERLREALRRL